MQMSGAHPGTWLTRNHLVRYVVAEDPVDTGAVLFFEEPLAIFECDQVVVCATLDLHDSASVVMILAGL